MYWMTLCSMWRQQSVKHGHKLLAPDDSIVILSFYSTCRTLITSTDTGKLTQQKELHAALFKHCITGWAEKLKTILQILHHPQTLFTSKLGKKIIIPASTITWNVFAQHTICSIKLFCIGMKCLENIWLQKFLFWALSLCFTVLKESISSSRLYAVWSIKHTNSRRGRSRPFPPYHCQ